MDSEDTQRNPIRLFDSDLPGLLTDALADDPDSGGFEVRYQPIVRLADASVQAVEALARWRHPVAGRVPPAVFVAMAERAGLIAVLDDFVLAQACRDTPALAATYGREVAVHVNISAHRMGRPDLEAGIFWALRRYRMAAQRLVLEVAHTASSGDLDVVVASMRRIRQLGVRVALDDFGADLDAFAQLRSLPVDMIKLDPMLICPNDGEWRTQSLCRSVLTDCKALNVQVVAEGVESLSQASALRDMGCELAQGHLYAPALPLAKLA
jgi:EAL domain-containing protein (putative c-di-GMP-specific phosphodiesterase class I)